MTEKQQEEQHEDWKSVAFTLVANAVKQSSTNIVQAIHERMEHAVHTMTRKIVVLFVVLLGLGLLLVGAAQFLGALLGMAAYGYMILGAAILIIALLVHFTSAE